MKNFIFTIVSLFLFIIPSSAQYFWGKQAMGDASTNGNDFAIDQQGNVFVVGNMDNTVTFDNVTVGDINGNSFEHNYIAKYSSDGDLEWVRTIKGNSNNELWGIALDGDGNAYVSGTYVHTNSFTILDFGNIQIVGNPSESGFVAKIDPDGNWEWASAIVSEDLLGSQHIRPMVVQVLPSGKILLNGYIKGPAIVGGQTFNPVNDGIQKIFFSCFDEDGNFEWFRHGEGHWGQLSPSPFFEMQLDAAGNSYVLCSFSDGASYESETLTHPFGGGFGVISFDADANLRWWKNISSSDAETLGGLTLDENANVYIAARKGGILYIGDDLVIDDLLFHIWLIKFDSNGNFGFAKGLFESTTNAGSAWIHDIAYHSDGYIIVAGGYETFWGSPKPILFGDTLGGGGFRNAYIAAYNTDNASYKGSLEISYPENTSDGEFLPKDLSMDQDGNLVMVGEFDYELSFGDFTFSSDLLNQMFAMKIDVGALIDLSTSALEIHQNHLDFKVYPNPASQYIFIKNERLIEDVEVLDYSGKTVMKIENFEQNKALDLSLLISGKYYLKIGQTVKPFIIQN